LKVELEKEIKYWQLDKGISKIYGYTHPDAQKLDELFKSVPDIFALKPQVTLNNWQKLKPLTVDDIMRNSQIDVDFKHDKIQFQHDKFGKGVAQGQMRTGTKVIDGVARIIFDSTNIQEGQFTSYKMNGYGRLFHKSGNYYIGMFKDNKRHGKGKFVFGNGDVQEGLFENGEYVGPEDPLAQ